MGIAFVMRSRKPTTLLALGFGQELSKEVKKMYDTHILSEVGARSVWEHGKKIGYAINITINNYRGQPLCCVDEITIEIDGKKVNPETMYLQHCGVEYKYLDIFKDDFPPEIYWVFGKFLRVVILNGEGIDQGIHNVKLTLGTRKSYTPTVISVCEKKITFA